MSFLHASLLLGGIIAVIPVILHLLGRKQPKAIVFPAIRFVRQTAVHAQRGWSIKRWLLMALRVLVILLLALALAAPRVQSGMYATYLMILLVVILAALATAAALTAYGTRLSWRATVTAGAIAAVLWIVGGSWLSAALLQKQSAPMPTASGPISAAVVIDTSPSMGYKYHNVTRLEAAKEMAMWLMDRLPVGSQIAIVNSDAGVRLNQDRVSANRLLDRTMVEGRAANLVHRISASIDALRKSELERREVYVLTDVSMTAWRDAEVSDIPAKLSRLENGLGKPNQENVLVQVIDVSVPANEIRNWSLNNFKLSQQSATPGSQVSISLDLQSAPGSGGEQIKVELAVEDATVNPLVRDNKSIVSKAVAVEQQMIEVGDGASIPFKFNLKNIVEGTNHFEVRIARPDPLEVDNIVYCTVEARTQNQTLVVADDEEEGRLVCKAIDPAFEAESQQVNKQEQREPLFRLATSSQLPSIDLSRFTSMVLYEPTNISADMSDRIKRWVAQGGGILVVLGPGFESPESLMNSPISNLLPGKVKRITRRALNDRSISLVPSIFNHPIWSVEMPVEEIPWGKYAVFRHWDIEELSEDASVLMRFTQSELPAVIEQNIEQGRIITFAVPYPGPQERGKLWSQLFLDWPGFLLFNGTVRYLSAWNKQQLNYLVDETAILENNVTQFPQMYMLHNPILEETRVESSNENLGFSFTRYPGQYRLRGSRPQGPVVRGFSVNVNRQEISLQRALPDSLDKALGKGQYRIAREKQDVQSSLGEGRFGRDLSPFLMLVFVLTIMAEQVMSSRFYGQPKKASG